MGSVGLNFGSPTSGQGFDVTTTVSLDCRQPAGGRDAVEEPADLAAEPGYGADFDWERPLALSTAAQSLDRFRGRAGGQAGVELQHRGPGADLGGGDGGRRQPYGDGGKLASTASYYSDAVQCANDLLTGRFTVTLGGMAKTITASSGGESLNNFADTINSANAGVTAASSTVRTGRNSAL